MKTSTHQWSPAAGWDSTPEESAKANAQQQSSLALVFCDPSVTPDNLGLVGLRDALPNTTIVGCSTAGQIRDERVSDVEIVATVVQFDGTIVRSAIVGVEDLDHSIDAGRELARALLAAGPGSDPQAVLVLSDGLIVNGTALLDGMREVFPEIGIFGGLAGDGSTFGRTWIVHGPDVKADSVVGVGLWGENLVLGHGSAGGWEAFGPVRKITKAQGSVLFELDHQPALALYKTYLGDRAAELPSSALLFPLRVTAPDGSQELVRTILSVDEDAQSMQFAGDITEGWTAQLMRTSIDRLVEGAASAAEQAVKGDGDGDTLALAVSCVGRRLVMGVRTDEEVEACLEVLGDDTDLVGFYSYGEISPVEGFASLHNQTMTITTIAERDS